MNRLNRRKLFALGAAAGAGLVLPGHAAFADTINTQAFGAAKGYANAQLDPFLNATQGSRKVKRIAVIGDSFVGGAGSTAPLTFGIPFAAALRAKYGDAGSGYIASNNGKMAGYSHSTNFLLPNSLPGSSSFTQWTDTAFHAKAFNGMASYRSGGIGGTDGNEQVTYTPNVADSFSRGVADTMTYAEVFFTLQSANAGFIIRQNDQSFSVATYVSGGASFTGAISTITLTVSALTGIVPRSGSEVKGGTAAGTIITANGSGNGSAGTYNVNTSQTVTSQAMTAAANVNSVVGAPQKIMHRLDPAKANNVQITGVFGDVEIHGVETYNGNAGVTVTDFGQGGTTAYQWASLDDASQRALWQLADFDVVYVVLGMNDRTLFEPALFGNSIATLVSRIQSCARTKVVLVRQTDPSDAATTYIQYYGKVLQNVASAMGCGYIDERTCPGFADYATANANGLMNADGVHRNGTGNTVIGNWYPGMITL